MSRRDSDAGTTAENKTFAQIATVRHRDVRVSRRMLRRIADRMDARAEKSFRQCVPLVGIDGNAD